MIRLGTLFFRAFSRTGLVDPKYYNQKYPDVARAQLNPNYHYLKYGIKEGRHPNLVVERFFNWIHKKTTSIMVRFFLDDAYYLRTYRDVRTAGISPAVHFAQTGRKEKRHLNRSLATVSGIFYSMKLEFAARPTTPLAREAAIERYKYELFESARHGIYEKIKAAAISKYLKKKAGENILLGSFQTLASSDLAVHGHPVESIEPAYPMTFFEPEIAGIVKERPPRTVEVPSKWIATIKNASVVGGFQVIADDCLIVYEPAADPHNGFVAGIWPYVVSLDQEKEILFWFRYKKEFRLPQAILLSGRCSPNYYHWLIEYLGRAYILDRREELKKIPLIVDANMFPQEFESLQAMLPDWPLYKLDDSTLLKVDVLHIPSTCTNLADNLREPMWKSSAICFRTLAYMQEAVHGRFGIDRTGSGEKKVFLARRSGRNITNTPEVEEVLASFGYEIVDTGQLSFEQQVRLFAQASVIVGAMGAAFTNLIFCRPGTQVLALSSPYTQLFCSQSNMALFAGCDYRILVGRHPLFQPGDEHTVSDPSLFLDSYAIDAGELATALQDIERHLS